jgi:hypothetical protein
MIDFAPSVSRSHQPSADAIGWQQRAISNRNKTRFSVSNA